MSYRYYKLSEIANYLASLQLGQTHLEVADLTWCWVMCLGAMHLRCLNMRQLNHILNVEEQTYLYFLVMLFSIIDAFGCIHFQSMQFYNFICTNIIRFNLLYLNMQYSSSKLYIFKLYLTKVATLISPSIGIWRLCWKDSSFQIERSFLAVGFRGLGGNW